MPFGGQSTLDLVNFENVRDGGVIETPTAYAMLVEVEPREWLTLSEERRSGVYVSFLTFLRGLQFPVQFLTMTTEFDGEPYIKQFDSADSLSTPRKASTTEADAEIGSTEKTAQPTNDSSDGASATDGGTPAETVADSAVLEYGRLAHAEWVDRTLEMANVRDRRFFVAVAVDKGEDDAEAGGTLNGIRDALPLPTRTQSVESEPFYLDEVWARAQRVASQLPRTRVEANILDSREAVMSILYRVYRGQEPPVAFNQGTLVRADDDALTDATSESPDPLNTFDDADRQETPPGHENDPAERPETVGDFPYNGRVKEGYVDTVDSSRLLQWYVRTIGPIGRENEDPSPRSIYLGSSAFMLSLVLAVGSLGLFFGSTRSLPIETAPILVRELSFGLAAGSLPTFLLSLVILLPSRRIANPLAVLGTGVTATAITLFEVAYPAQWSGTPTEQTALVIPMYAGGLFVLVIAVGFALHSRRSTLDHTEETRHQAPAVESENRTSRSDRSDT